MLLAVNYSVASADLLYRGIVDFDLFKAPAWLDLAAQARAQHPTYVHFPLIVGTGLGDALDGETNAVADWKKVESLLRDTDTRYVNVHLAPAPEHAPAIPPDSADRMHGEAIAERMIHDLLPVIRRFGAEQVIAENDQYNGGQTLRAAYLPDVIRAVIEETDCGLLLDVSHARIAAETLEMPVEDYLRALPLERVREMHVTGVQRFEGTWLTRMRAAGVPEIEVQRRAGQLQDHLPMTDEDWKLLATILERTRAGQVGAPWTVTFEYGGVGLLWEAVTDAAILANQIPRLKALVRPVAPRTEIGSS
jgi:uncharacterized protein (UPF0276 family)